jgi:hypothetical protein
MVMDTSDPYPNDGTYFQPDVPELTKAANAEEKMLAAQSLPFIDGVLAWFDDVIATTDSITAARVYAEKYGKTYESVAIAMDISREYLEQKRGEMQSLALTFRK